MYFRTKFQVPSIILTRFRRGRGVILPPDPKTNLKKSETLKLCFGKEILLEKFHVLDMWRLHNM